MDRKYICPSCKEKAGVNIFYGMPSDEVVKRADLGQIALGGCEIQENQPERRCLSCGAEWLIKKRLRFTKKKFEAAKKKWLKEVVKGRSWTAMMDENDRRGDK